MAGSPRILAFAGSGRAGSFNMRLLRVAAAGAERVGAQVTLLNLNDLELPILDQDLEDRIGEPAGAKAFKDLLRAHDGLLIASPEHNGSFSALLKNALDWASRRREGEKSMECFENKLAAIMAASPGGLGGVRGLFQLRYLLGIFRVTVLANQVTVATAGEAFTPAGALADPVVHAATERLGATLANRLAAWRG
jgi:NAD(P)H-dependent FMN reductase